MLNSQGKVVTLNKLSPHPLLPCPLHHSLFFMMFRALKLMDFQPYLGVITRSLSTAALSLVHFFILAFVIFFVFSIYGFIVFGAQIKAVGFPPGLPVVFCHLCMIRFCHVH